MGIGSYAVGTAQVDMLGAVQIAARFLPGEFQQHVEIPAKPLHCGQVECSLGKAPRGVSEPAKFLGCLGVRDKGARVKSCPVAEGEVLPAG